MNEFIKETDDYFVYEYGNKYSKDKFTREQANEDIKTLENCYDCINCKDCKDCKDCIGCYDCKDCEDCIGCYDCYDCASCIGCYNCDDCADCIRCGNCEGCFMKENRFKNEKIKYSNDSKMRNIPLDTIDRVLYSNITNLKDDPVELIIKEIEEDEKKDTFLKAYKETVEEGYPFKIELFAKKLGLKILYTYFRDYLGYIDNFGNIHVNKNDGIYRNRFTIAHMIAHYIMHGGYRDVNIKSQYFIPSSFEERQANMLAGMILMPYKNMEKIYYNYSKISDNNYIPHEDYDLVGRFQQEFDLSAAAITVRISVTGMSINNGF